jgi:hypothetical protein
VICIVEHDRAVLDRRARRDVGDVVQHPVRRVVVGADVLPGTAADLGQERHLVEGVARHVGPDFEPVAPLGRHVERDGRRRLAVRDVLLRAVHDGRERPDRDIEVTVPIALQPLGAVAVDQLPFAVRHERRDRCGGGLLGVVQGHHVLAPVGAVDA